MTCPAVDPCAPSTRCDRDTANNVWVEHGVGPGDCLTPGVCLLDSMNDCDIIYVLERNERARADLLRVTSDPHLIDLANQVQRLPLGEEEDALMNMLNNEPLPLYTHFHGQPPWNQ